MYRIGSKMFPVASKSKTKVFMDKNTIELEHTELADSLNQEVFSLGRCYKNADIVCAKARELGLYAEYYSGWLFASSTLPIHHAWVVIEGNVVDTSISLSQMRALRSMNTTGENWRKKVAPKLQSMMKDKQQIKNDGVWGKIPEFLLYVGCPDTSSDAKSRFRHLLQKFPDHPSYAHKSDPLAMSDLQKELKNL